MSKIDFTKPLRFRNANNGRFAHANYIGIDPYRVELKSDYTHIVRLFDNYQAINPQNGDVFGYQGTLENAPVTHQRWVVLYSYTTDNKVFSNTLTRVPTADDLKLYHKVIAIKEVTIEEGEGLLRLECK